MLARLVYSCRCCLLLLLSFERDGSFRFTSHVSLSLILSLSLSGVARVHVEGDDAAHESLDEDLYVEVYVLFVVVLRWGLLLENEDERAFYPLIS